MTAPRLRPRKHPRQQRSQETVAVILEATRRVLVQRGYARASTAESARRAGVSIGSLYQYFPSKAALLAALSEQHSQAMLQVFEARLQQVQGLSLREAIRVAIQAELEAFQLNLPLHRVLFEEAPRLAPPAHIDRVQDQVVDLVKRALALRAEPLRALDPALAAFVVVHAIDGVLQAALKRRPELVLTPALLEECTELVLRYLS